MPKYKIIMSCNDGITLFFISCVLFQDGGLYNRLYLCLYDLVADLVRLANGDSVSK